MNFLKSSKVVYFVFFLLAQSLYAQNAGFTLKGKIVESQEQSPIEFATILLLEKDTDKAIGGTTTDAAGLFEIKTSAKEFQLKISFIGFETQYIKDIDFSTPSIDLGVIQLTEVITTTDEVVIQAEKSQLEFKLDKRVFRVGKDLSSTGASALEVLNNVPSVNVNIEGVISLRGSAGVQVLINGKPSVLTSEEGNALGSITAEMIDRVEVITNPSAKYDAEGTSGIINIVLKKDERKGINGSVTLNTGVPHNHSLGLSLNRRTEKFNLFAQLGAGYRNLPNDSESINEDLGDNSQVISQGDEEKFETFLNLNLGVDYYFDPNNVITLAGNFAYEFEDQPSIADFQFLDGAGELISQWEREEITSATNPKWQYELQYKRDFKDHKDHDLLFSALGNSFAKDQQSQFLNTTLLGEDLFGNQETITDFREDEYTFKLDYTKPLSKTFTIETGSQYVITDVSNDFAVNDWVNGEWTPIANLTNLFEYDQKVLGVYGTGAYEGNKWGLKLGLRLETTDLQTLLVNTGEVNNQDFANLFPSIHSSYKINEQFSMQAGYSRRIWRPGLWDLNPFLNIRNNFAIRTGNPALQPEFTDSYEITGIYVFENLSLNFSTYHRFTTDVVERIATFENEVSTSKPVNIGTNRATGLEFNAKYNPVRWFTVLTDLNYLYFNREGTFENTVFDFNADQYSAKVMSKFKLPADIDLEVVGQYRSRVQMVQGEMSENIFADLGIRKKLLKGKAVINLSVRDIFKSRIMEINTFQPDFYLYNWRRRGRFVTVGFSYGFGKGEAMEFSGQKRY
ncbi:MAG: TonB-dependent receptor [Bacteroidota bacterium]